VSLGATSPTGEVVFDTATKRYRSSAGTLPPKWVGGAQGKVVYRENDFYVMLGDTLFQMTPPPPGDGGTPDGGLADASSMGDADDATMDAGANDVSTGGTGGTAGTGAGGSGGGPGGAGGATTGAGGATGGGTGPGGAAGSAGAVGAGGSTGSSGMAGSAGAAGSKPPSTTDAGKVDASSGGAAGSGDLPPDDDGGCSIGSTRTKTTTPSWALVAAAALALATRRRRLRESRCKKLT
jgi:MYXO-CTERM domain-containing protein